MEGNRRIILAVGALCVFLGGSSIACRARNGEERPPANAERTQLPQTTGQDGGEEAAGASPSAQSRAPQEDATGEVSKASLAVMDFTFHTSSGPQGHREFNSELLTDRIVTALGRTRKFRLVERQRISDLLREFKLTDQGFTSKALAVKAGDMVGADYLVLGSITHMSASKRTEEIAYTSETTTVLSGRISGTMRVVDSRTGEIAGSWPEEIAKSAHSENESISLESIYESMQAELAESVARAIVDAVYPIKVASVSPEGVLFLNAGRGRGLEVGDTVELFQPGAAIIDPDTRERLGVEEERIGRAKVIEVRDRLVLARVLESAARLVPGTIARKASKAALGAGSVPDQSAERPKLNW